MSAENVMTESERAMDDLLTGTFNSILRIEEKQLLHHMTEGLTISELHTLCAVGLSEANPMKAIAAKLSVAMATLTVAMNRLEQKGYVVRERAEADRRMVLVRLTVKGRKAVRTHDVFHRRMVQECLADLTADEASAFARGITKVKAFFDAENEALEENGAREGYNPEPR